MANVADKLQPLAFWGVNFQRDGKDGGQAIGDCPDCGKEGHFYANPDTGQYDCKVCDFVGNVTVFLEWTLAKLLADTTTPDLRKLAADRGIPIAPMQRAEVAYDREEGRYVVPIRNERGRIVDLRHWTPGGRGMQSTWGVKVGLWGLDRLASVEDEDRGTVYVCEGEWDGLALDACRRRGGKPGCVVAVPGAGTFKKEWIQYFQRRKVVLLYDADGSGDRGMVKVAEALTGVAKSIRYIAWPDGTPEGYDVRDFLRRKNGKAYPDLAEALTTWTRLMGLVGPGPRADPKATKGTPTTQARGQAATPNGDGEHGAADDDGPPATWAETVGAYRDWMELTPDLENALKAMFATVFSAKLGDGDPLWLWLVGPAASGKTTLAMSLREADECEFSSTLTPTSLISGWQGANDPSLIPRLADRCLVVKEGTTLLQMPTQIQDQLFGILRDAYDGCVQRHYGNGVYRNYSHRFAFFGAVTNAIHGHTQASLGERTLKFQLTDSDVATRSRIMDAIFGQLEKAKDRDAALRSAAARFLRRPFPSPADIAALVPMRYRERMKGLAEIVAWIRSPVVRDKYRRDDLKYRPAREAPNRILSQLFRLAGLLAYVTEERELGDANYAIVERVACDTAIGWHMEMVAAMASGVEGPGRAWTRKELETALGLPTTTVHEQTEDLCLKGLVVKVDLDATVRKARLGFKLCREVRDHWRAAKIAPEVAAQHARRIAGARRRRTLAATEGS